MKNEEWRIVEAQNSPSIVEGVPEGRGSNMKKLRMKN
jgi:hypothetical protein